MRAAALVYNPAAGRGRHGRVLAAVLAELARGGWAAEAVATPGPAEATRLVRELARDVEAVFALGGDGTVREVAAGLLGTGVPLGILPGGTVNLLALALGLPGDPVAAAAAAARLAPRPIDVGLAGGSPFLMMVSAGLDASALATLDPGFKRRFGRGAVVCRGVLEWWRYGYPSLQVFADGRPVAATFAAVANIRFYGGPFNLVPSSRLDDRRLDLLTFHGAGRAATLSFVADLLRGAHLRRPDVAVTPVEEVILGGPAGVAAQLDGDVCREALPLTVRIAPEPLAVFAPPASGES